MSTTGPGNKDRWQQSALFNGQPINLALCRHFGSAMHLGDVFYVPELRDLPGKKETL